MSRMPSQILLDAPTSLGPDPTRLLEEMLAIPFGICPELQAESLYFLSSND
ncbi:hypothetical protein D3C75_537880 [compost metagenome]